MKRVVYFLALAFCLTAITTCVSAQTTYTWNQSASNVWTFPANWTPARAVPAPNDILVFSGSSTPTATVTDVPNELIGELHVVLGATTTLAAAGDVTLTITGGASPIDLEVTTGSTLIVSGVANNLTTFVGPGAIGSISGSITFMGEHRLDAADAGGITFNSGSTCTYDATGAEGAFTDFGTANAIVFAPGSTYVHGGGGHPFGLTQPSSKVVFNVGSLYRHESSGPPSFNGRTYANFELNHATANLSVIGSNAVSINNLTITAGTLNFNLTGTPGHSIKGNISVASGATLNFAPASAGTVNLNGASVQTISGDGDFGFNDADSTFVINNANGITLSTDLTLDNGILTLTLGNITVSGVLTIGSAETVNRTSGYVIGNLEKFFAAAGSRTFEVGTANGYSPVTVNATGSFPAQLVVSATQGAHPSVNASTSIQRYWTLGGAGNYSKDLTFQYLAGDVMGTEANYKVIRISGGTPVSFPSSTVNTAGDNATITGVSSFSDWTVGESVSPTATGGSITGTIMDSQGAPVAGAVINVNGSQNRKFITDANGNYRFDNVEANGFYTVTPSRVNYTFSPSSHSFSQVGASTQSAFTAVPLVVAQNANPSDTPECFVRQHYLDFLGREPDEAGFNFWSDQILECGSDANCIEQRRENVSAAYFFSIEFQRTGGLVERLYRASYGVRPQFAEFMADSATIARNVVVGRTGWEQLLAANEEAFFEAWMDRPAFRAAYDMLANDRYVDSLIAHTGVGFTPSERDALVNDLNSGLLTRAGVLERIAEDERFVSAKRNETFVTMQYFGYLQRDPDDSGFQFWLNKLNQFGGDFERAEMVKAFIVSGEYRDRFPR